MIIREPLSGAMFASGGFSFFGTALVDFRGKNNMPLPRSTNPSNQLILVGGELYQSSP